MSSCRWPWPPLQLQPQPFGDDSLLQTIQQSAEGAAAEMGSTVRMLRVPPLSESVPNSPVPKADEGKGGAANPLAASVPVDPSK